LFHMAVSHKPLNDWACLHVRESNEASEIVEANGNAGAELTFCHHHWLWKVLRSRQWPTFNWAFGLPVSCDDDCRSFVLGLAAASYGNFATVNCQTKALASTWGKRYCEGVEASALVQGRLYVIVTVASNPRLHFLLSFAWLNTVCLA
jgi:hypothetical protein